MAWDQQSLLYDYPCQSLPCSRRMVHELHHRARADGRLLGRRRAESVGDRLALQDTSRRPPTSDQAGVSHRRYEPSSVLVNAHMTATAYRKHRVSPSSPVLEEVHQQIRQQTRLMRPARSRSWSRKEQGPEGCLSSGMAMPLQFWLGYYSSPSTSQASIKVLQYPTATKESSNSRVIVSSFPLFTVHLL